MIPFHCAYSYILIVVSISSPTQQHKLADPMKSHMCLGHTSPQRQPALFLCADGSKSRLSPSHTIELCAFAVHSEQFPGRVRRREEEVPMRVESQRKRWWTGWWETAGDAHFQHRVGTPSSEEKTLLLRGKCREHLVVTGTSLGGT